MKKTVGSRKNFVGSQKSAEYNECDDLDDLAQKLDQILERATNTGQRLEKLEHLRKMEAHAKPTSEKTKQKPNLSSVYGEMSPPSRPETTKFRAPKQQFAKSHDVTLDQIFEALQCLRDEVNELQENHTEMVSQINTIKKLIH